MTQDKLQPERAETRRVYSREQDSFKHCVSLIASLSVSFFFVNADCRAVGQVHGLGRRAVASRCTPK